ncbi:MAG: ferredoxin [Erysipelotrichaceae bacterium]|nr:ferredoxin [Erysipelotrichaceae bacterium]
MAKVRIEKEHCTACGLCNAMAPDYFDWDDDGLMGVIQEEIAEGDEDLIESCVADCPTGAIIVE